MNIMKVTVPCEISDKEIDYIMDTVFCDSIEYWCDEVRLESESISKDLSLGDYISRGGAIGLHEEDEEWHTLTKEKLLSGLEKCIGNYFDTMIGYGAIVMDEDTERMWIDSAGIDSVLADCIIQYAIFGELVYG